MVYLNRIDFRCMCSTKNLIIDHQQIFRIAYYITVFQRVCKLLKMNENIYLNLHLYNFVVGTFIFHVDQMTSSYRSQSNQTLLKSQRYL